jgi:hypothetical protein
MDIEEIEKVLTNLYADFKKHGASDSSDVFGFMACQLLLHIYKKLESIDERLDEMHVPAPHKW